MASLAVEAILAFNDVKAQSYATGLASIFKLSDFVSDFLFIRDLVSLGKNMEMLGRRLLQETSDSDNSDVHSSSSSSSYQPWIPIGTYIALASIFTLFGLVFDVAMIYVNIKEHKEKKAQEKEEQKTTTDLFWEEGFTSRKFWSKVSNNFFESDATENEANWVWWRHLNVGLEEVPQLLLLIIFYIDWSRGFILSISDNDQHGKSYWEKTKASIFVSAAFTSFMLFKVAMGYHLFRRNQQQMNALALQRDSKSVFQGMIPPKNISDDSKSDNQKDVVVDKLENGQGLEKIDADKNSNVKTKSKCEKGTSDNSFFYQSASANAGENSDRKPLRASFMKAKIVDAKTKIKWEQAVNNVATNRNDFLSLGLNGKQEDKDSKNATIKTKMADVITRKSKSASSKKTPQIDESRNIGILNGFANSQNDKNSNKNDNKKLLVNFNNARMSDTLAKHRNGRTKQVRDEGTVHSSSHYFIVGFDGKQADIKSSNNRPKTEEVPKQNKITEKRNENKSQNEASRSSFVDSFQCMTACADDEPTPVTTTKKKAATTCTTKRFEAPADPATFSSFTCMTKIDEEDRTSVVDQSNAGKEKKKAGNTTKDPVIETSINQLCFANTKNPFQCLPNCSET